MYQRFSQKAKAFLTVIMVGVSPVLVVHAQAPASTSAPMTAEQLREERAYTLGTAAYLWGFTMNELYPVRAGALSKPGSAVNTFAHSRVLLTPEQARLDGVVRSNSATLYSSAWLELSVEPIVLEFPPIADRYYTFNYVDYYQRNENLSNATVGRSGGAYAFVGPSPSPSRQAAVARVSYHLPNAHRCIPIVTVRFG